MRFHLLFCSVVICFIWVAWASAEEINESFVESEVKFAIEELQGLSDSGVALARVGDPGAECRAYGGHPTGSPL